ncbi:MAG: hypothetical protein L0Y54_12155 [Sporichthyaceae bacterium]|nr:hypothetical protein [Sporichthyaceae bacterium]
MSFSAGGDGELGRIGWGEHELGVSWDGVLPEPIVSGSTLTYPSVLPDVDLVVSVDADGTGFSEVLVVKTPQAAANPALDAVSFPVQLPDQLTVVEQGGGFDMVDESGAQIFTSPTPRMWDSSGTPDGEAMGAAQQMGGVLEDPVADPVAERVEAPLEGDTVAVMPVEVTEEAVTITPDEGMLSDPGTAWPVYIDPTYDAGNGVTLNARTMIQSCCGADDNDWNFTGDQGLGRCEVALDSDCNYNNTKRLIWKFDLPAAVRGSDVLDAEFNAYQTTAYDCDTGWVRAYETASITSGTTWSNFHAEMDGDSGDPDLLDSVDQTRRTGCSLGPGRTYFDVTDGVQDAADASQTTVRIGLRGANETDMEASWKRFRYDAALSITFNRPPNTPTSVDLLEVPGNCVNGSGRPFIRTTTPTMTATLSDPDSEDSIQANFEVYKVSDNSLVWNPPKTAAQASNKSHSLQVPAGTLVHGVSYDWFAQGWDEHGKQGPAVHCEFTVDTVPPDSAPAVTAVAGQPAVYVEDGWAGGKDIPGSFSFTNGGGVAVGDVVKYEYSFGGPSFGSVALLSGGANGDSVDIPFSPGTVGAQTLYVRSVDAAGWPSPQKLYRFNVNTAAKAGWWKLNDGTGTAGQDATVNNNDVTLTGTGASWSDGPVGLDNPDKALHLDGIAGGATTAGPVAKTNASFTVTALVLTDGATGSRVAVSQDGVNTSGFKLGQLSDSSLCPAATGPTCWAFWVGNSDVVGTSHTRALPIPTPENDFAIAADTWTSLVGVYDATANQIRLYVNGELAGTAPYTAGWGAVGKLRIGQAMSGGAAQYFWSGDIDDVRVYKSALDEDTIRRIAAGSQDPGDIPQ